MNTIYQTATWRRVAEIMAFYLCIILPNLALANQSTNFSATTPWEIGSLDAPCDCPLVTSLDASINAAVFFNSPQDALNFIANYVGQPAISLSDVTYDYGIPSYFGQVYAPGGCQCLYYIRFLIQYRGTNYGQICPDGSYVEAGQPCACQCSDVDKGLGSCCDNPGQCEVGNPISLAFGNKYEEITDYQTASENPLSFTRYYNSLGNTNSRAITIGLKWRSTYDRYLRIVSANGVVSAVVAERADGQELVFTASGTNWTSDTDVDTKLTGSIGSWTLSDPDDTVETYASGATSTGVLTSTRYRNGYTQFLLYTAGLLSSVSDSFNRSLTFTYQGGLLHTVTAPSGLVVTFGYSLSAAAPRLASATYSSSPATSQRYVYEDASNPFGLTGLIDENGNRYATWTYDSQGRATSSSHGNGADLTTVAYNDTDGSRVVTNALEGVTVYKFQTLQNIPKVVEIDRLATTSALYTNQILSVTTIPAATRVFYYDANGYQNFASDWNTNYISRVNDVHGQPTSITEAAYTPVARATTANYLTNFHLPFQIAIPGITTSIGYDANGNPLTITQTDTSSGTVPYSTSGFTRSWTNTFDNVGHTLSITGPRTDVTATTYFGYDASNNLAVITNAMGQITILTNFTGSGLPLTMIDPNHAVTTFTYDSRDRLLTGTVHAIGGDATTSFAYDSVGDITNITLPDASILQCQYDSAHRFRSVNNAVDDFIDYHLDAAGNVTNILVTGSHVIYETQSAVFDQLGRMVQQIGAASQTTTYGYDGNGNAISITDGLTNKTVRAFDALNRLVSVLDPLQNAARYGYDSQDNVISVTDPRQLVTSYARNGFGQIIQESSPDKQGLLF